MTRVLGLDPGSIRYGYGIIDAAGVEMQALEFGVLTAPANWPLHRRLARIGQQLALVLEEHRPTVCAMEAGYLGSFAATLALGAARGVGGFVSTTHGADVVEYAPMTVKQRCAGSGKVQKFVLADVVALRLHLDAHPPEDAADALAVAITYVLEKGSET